MGVSSGGVGSIRTPPTSGFFVKIYFINWHPIGGMSWEERAQAMRERRAIDPAFNALMEGIERETEAMETAEFVIYTKFRIGSYLYSLISSHNTLCRHRAYH